MRLTTEYIVISYELVLKGAFISDIPENFAGRCKNSIK